MKGLEGHKTRGQETSEYLAIANAAHLEAPAHAITAVHALRVHRLALFFVNSFLTALAEVS